MSRKVFIVAHDMARNGIAAFAKTVPLGWWCVLSEPTKKRIQEEKSHPMIGDIAKHCTFMDRKHDADDWKRLLVEAFAKAMREAGTPVHHDGRVLPSLDFQRVVQLGIQTSEFYVSEAAEFIEFLYAWGADRGVAWTEPKVRDRERQAA